MALFHAGLAARAEVAWYRIGAGVLTRAPLRAAMRAAASAWNVAVNALLVGGVVLTALVGVVALLWLGVQLVSWWIEFSYAPVQPSSAWPRMLLR
jgi:hypothetical protein